MNSDFILEIIMDRANECIENNDFEGAFRLYSDVVDLVPDTEDGINLKYNLASMYAQGLGCEKDLIKAASLFNECAKSGDEDALKRILKCFMDYVIDNSDREIYEFSANINKFVSVVFTDEDEASYIIKQLINYFNNSGREEIAEKLSGYLADTKNLQ